MEQFMSEEPDTVILVIRISKKPISSYLAPMKQYLTFQEELEITCCFLILQELVTSQQHKPPNEISTCGQLVQLFLHQSHSCNS